MDVVLYHPEIPPNTGNIMRLCANTGVRLCLVRPLGFELDDTKLRRAGLDYREFADVAVFEWLDEAIGGAPRLLAFSQYGKRFHSDVEYRPDDVLLFGPESVGLPEEVLHDPRVAEVLRIPMLPDRRSLNLANAVSIVVYEAWRQQGFPGAV